MSTAELKLQLIREIDQLPEEMLSEVVQFVSTLRNASLEKPAPKRKIGALKGTLIYMAPDFDEPLEDFKDYM